MAVVVAVTAALAASAVPAQAEPAQAQGQDSRATAAAKKKKKKRKKKCRRTDQSPVFNALSCRALVRTFPNDPPTPAGNERYDFCRNNTYRYRKVNFDFDGRSFTTTYRGRWKVVSSTSGSAGLSGAIQYTVVGFRSVYTDGTPAESAPPGLISSAIAFGPFGVDFAGGTFLMGKARC
jgi:opacity protein-like surface antigen